MPRTILLSTVIAILATGSVALYIQATSPGSKLSRHQHLLVEKLPGSKFHSPDGTWWGYNQSKIVRFKDYVFSYNIDNKDSNSKTVSHLTLLKKSGRPGLGKRCLIPHFSAR
ncbi:MAG: hypothetical protein HYZ62_01210 [Candidatus Andersenbacteria bacterium]|nr:hypothetical protein [Candidatus Andersenbacteria bacterium]